MFALLVQKQQSPERESVQISLMISCIIGMHSPSSSLLQ
jgi:hypothetical protein